jgi:hypothetical protein
MEEQCKIAILEYANEEMQRNAVLFEEHTEYVKLVLTLFRDSYHKQVREGATQFKKEKHITDYLDSIKPW